MFFSVSLHSQTYLNLEWQVSNGLPDSVDWTASALDLESNFVMTGNTVSSTELTNILTTKIMTSM